MSAATTPVDVITTTTGGSTNSNIIASSDALLGFETAQSRPPEDLAVEFCDFPFTSDDAGFEDHLNVVRREQPRYAVAPDIEDDRDPDTVIEQASQLARHADTVIVVPKSIHPTDVPDADCFRVGVPLADYGSDAPWQIGEYRDAGDLHFLGGSPRLQLETAKYLPNVRSVDSASIIKGAETGSVFAPTAERSWHPTGDQAGYYDRVKMSVRNSVAAWTEHTTAYDRSGDYDVPYDVDEYETAVEAAQAEIRTQQQYRDSGARGAPPTIDAGDEDLWSQRDLEESTMDAVDWAEREEDLVAEQIRVLQRDADAAGLQTGLSDY